MKRAISLVFLVLFISSILSAGHIYLAPKGNYFNPSNQYFKDIYGGGFQYGLELGIDVQKNISVWISGGFFKKSGELTYSQEETIFKIIPIEAGIHLKLSKKRLFPTLEAV